MRIDVTNTHRGLTVKVHGRHVHSGRVPRPDDLPKRVLRAYLDTLEQVPELDTYRLDMVPGHYRGLWLCRLTVTHHEARCYQA